MKLTPRRKGTRLDEIPPVEIQVPRITVYRECLKNYAAKTGGHVLDGCQEFIACGEEGSLDALKCATCDCHRNFHRKEVVGCHCQHVCNEREQTSGAVSHPPSTTTAVTNSGLSESDDQEGSTSASDAATKKRFRTQYSTEQKEKMFSFAEALGWRIQKHDESTVESFCAEIGVKRHALKAWMRNNKHTSGRKDLE